MEDHIETLDIVNPKKADSRCALGRAGFAITFITSVDSRFALGRANLTSVFVIQIYKNGLALRARLCHKISLRARPRGPPPRPPYSTLP